MTKDERGSASDGATEQTDAERRREAERATPPSVQAGPERIATRQSDVLSRPQFGSGRLGTYTMMGAASGVVPLPWIPDAIVRRVRGALIHDLTSRHGLSLTPDARSALTEPEGGEGPRSFIDQGVKFAVMRAS